ncbi:MAG: rod shape-determining protein MreC [Alphaproteobacteria bacterium]
MKRRTKKIGGATGSKAFPRIAALPLLSGAGASGFLVALAAFFLFVSMFQPQMLGGLRVSAADTFAPVLNVISTPLQKAAIFVRDVTGLAEIQAENARLAQENIKLREWYQTALLLEAENKSLRELMNVKVEPGHTYITARILSDSASSFAKSLLVSAGSQDGVRRGQAVIAGDGLIGRVIETGARSARVLLITDINSRVPVLIENSRQQAIFSGQNGRNGTLVHLPPESKVSEGARVITSGVGGVFPVGLPLGRVSAVGDEITVEPFADFNRLMHVRIVNRPEDPNLDPAAGL